jgi:hypothetical protein
MRRRLTGPRTIPERHDCRRQRDPRCLSERCGGARAADQRAGARTPEPRVRQAANPLPASPGNTSPGNSSSALRLLKSGSSPVGPRLPRGFVSARWCSWPSPEAPEGPMAPCPAAAVAAGDAEGSAGPCAARPFGDGPFGDGPFGAGPFGVGALADGVLSWGVLACGGLAGGASAGSSSCRGCLPGIEWGRPYGDVQERSWDSAGALPTRITPTTSAAIPPAWTASMPGVIWILSPNTRTPSRIPTSGSPAEMAGSDTCSGPALNALCISQMPIAPAPISAYGAQVVNRAPAPLDCKICSDCLVSAS